jgi:hypothetical protein
MRMREELLAHLTAIYEEELARSGDEAAARAETARRFGDPTALTPELEASVTWRDRIDARLDRWFGWRPGEPLVRHLLRMAGLGYLILLALLVLTLVLSSLKRPFDSTILPTAMLVYCWTVMAVVGTVWVVSAGWLATRARAALYGVAPNRVRAVGYVLLLSLLTPAMALGLYLAVLGDVPGALALIVPADPASLVVNGVSVVLIPVITLWLTGEVTRRVARRAEWAALDIGG